MKVDDKYTTAEKITKDKTNKESKKVTLSNDAYAICEFIEFLINKVEHARTSMMTRR